MMTTRCTSCSRRSVASTAGHLKRRSWLLLSEAGWREMVLLSLAGMISKADTRPAGGSGRGRRGPLLCQPAVRATVEVGDPLVANGVQKLRRPQRPGTACADEEQLSVLRDLVQA